MSDRSNKNLLRTLRSAYRTVRRGLGRGPFKLMNSNVGDHSSQCNKFQRFEELYTEYVRDKNAQVAMALARIRRNQDSYFNILYEISTTPSETLAHAIDKGISDIEFNSLADLSYIKDIPDEPANYNVLKEELRFFIIFLRKYVIDKLKKYKETGENMNLDALLTCTPVNYNAPYGWTRSRRGAPKRRKTRKHKRRFAGLNQ
jgi:hypothetical protein